MAIPSLTTWFMATRPQFFTVIILPIILGTAFAWYEQHSFSFLYFIWALLAGIICHAAVNVFNDYFDHLNKTDIYNQTPLTPFAGGSRMIQNGLLTPTQTYYFGLTLLLLAVILGLALVWTRGLSLLWIGLIGILSGYFYSAPPFFFNGRGLGELLVGLNFGILSVLGAYYVQVQMLHLQPIIIAIPISCLVAAILYINEFPDYFADKQAGKKNLVVRLGKAQARWLYVLLISISFISIIISVFYQQLPPTGLFSLLTIPLAMLAIRVLFRHYNQPTALIPAIKYTIALHTLMSSILILIFIFNGNNPQ